MNCPSLITLDLDIVAVVVGLLFIYPSFVFLGGCIDGLVKFYDVVIFFLAIDSSARIQSCSDDIELNFPGLSATSYLFSSAVIICSIVMSLASLYLYFLVIL